jgi:chaperonin GroES
VAFIQSSRPNLLASVVPLHPVDDGELIDETEPEEDSPVEPRAKPRNVKKQLVSWIGNENIARDVDYMTLDALGVLVVQEYEIDERSCAEWKQEAETALKFATQKATPKQYPWPDASNVIYPLITRAAIEFASTTYPAIIANRNVVKGAVWGGDKGTPAMSAQGTPVVGADGKPQWLVPPGAKTARADRIGSHMSWQLLDQLEYWEWETDTLLHQIPIVGGAVRKTYRNPMTETNESVLVPLTNLIWNKGAKSFSAAPRHTEIITLQPFEIEEYERADETFLKISYGAPAPDAEGETPDPADTSAPQVFLEQHRRYDLDGDGYPEPLIVTVCKQSSKVVRIVARYNEKGIKFTGGEVKVIKPVDWYTLFPFFPDPRGGSYPIGFGHLLKPLNEAINTTMNQMFDAGHLQIAGGGFIGTSLSLHSGPVQFQLGEYKPVNNKGQSIRDSVFPIPFPGPNGVLFQLLGFLTQAAEAIAATQNIINADAANLSNMAPTTLMLLISQGMKTYTAIHKRIYRALKSEFQKLYELNRLYLEEDERFKVGDDWREVTPEDYRLGGGVEPIADPTQITDMQRLGRAMIVKEFANDPLCNPLEVRRRYFDACQIDRVDEILLPSVPAPQPTPEQQLATQELQLKVASAQSKMGQERALELQQYTQAMLNFAKARSELTQPQIAWMEGQLDAMRLHIEALNTTVKAADVDAKMHGHDTHLQAVKERARQVANEHPETEPSGNGADGPGVPAMAPPSDQQNPVSLPAGPGGGLPGPGPQLVGGGAPQG